MSGRSKLLTWGLPLIGLAALAAGTGMVVKNRPVSPEEDPPRQPTTAPVTEGTSQYIGAIGVSEPIGEPIAIAAHSGGIVEEVPVTIGARVDAGATLLRLDARREQAEVLLRERRVAVAMADVESLRAGIPPGRASVRSAEAALVSARATVSAAEADRDDRANRLRVAQSVDDPRAIASEEVDVRRFAVQQAEARLATAVAAVAEAEARIAQAQAELARLVNPEGGDGPDLLAVEQRVAEAAGELDRARVDLALREVRSPRDVYVLQVNVRPGEFASASDVADGLLVLGPAGNARLRVEIDEVDIPRFRSGARAWASPRGDAQTRIELAFLYAEPLVVPKRNLAGRTSELVDTRVLQVVYDLGIDLGDGVIGQQYDVYIGASK